MQREVGRACLSGRPRTAHAFRRPLLALGAFAASGWFATCAGAGETPKVHWALESEKVEGLRGQRLSLQLTAVIPDGWHIYALKKSSNFMTPTQIAVGPDTLVKLAGPIAHPPAHLNQDYGEKIEVFEGTVKFEIPIAIAVDAKPGAAQARVTLSWQACRNVCIEENAAIPFTVAVQDGPVVPEAPSSKSAPVDTGRSKSLAESAPEKKSTPVATASNMGAKVEQAKKKGILAYLWIAMGAGGLALLTPCVFPMIPITVSFFTKRKQVSRARSIRDAGIYALGIIATFTGIGILFTLLMGATGLSEFASNPWVNLAIAALFVILALNLFGAFEIQVPTGILNLLNAKASEDDGIGSILLMGLVFSLTSFTCTVPFVGTALFSTAQGDWLWPIAGMLGFSSVFAAPFFLLALFPAALKSLPKSGGWLNSVKVVMGFLELAAALKFVSGADLAWRWGLLTREAFLSIWVALALLSAAYLLGVFRFAHDSAVAHVGVARIFWTTFFLSCAIWLGTGIFGKPLGSLDAFAPPKVYPSESEEGWLNDWETGLAEARRTNTRLFVDFSGFT